MKTKNFLFTAVLTFGAILFATNVSAQEVTFEESTITAGTGTVGNVELVLKLTDIQELTVGSNSKVVFAYDTRDDYSSTTEVSETAVNQLTVFSTKKYNITVKATEFTTDEGTNNTLTDGLSSFTVQATKVNNVEVEGNSVTLSSSPLNLFGDSQSRTKDAAGYKIDIDYKLTNPSLLIDKMESIATATDFGKQEEFASTVTYTIIPG